MKTIIFYFLLAGALWAQTTYGVVPGTKNNEISLSIVNESTLTVEKINVAVINSHKGIEMCNSLVEITKLNGGEEKEALFSFDAKRTPSANKDTIKFLITDTYGNIWKKDIVIEFALPKEFKLEQNYPNPFNPSTTIEFTIPVRGRYSISIYNTLGQLVKVLADDEYDPGYYKTTFDAGKYASGMYIYKLSGTNADMIKKMILVK
jgi:hypothetical protein